MDDQEINRSSSQSMVMKRKRTKRPRSTSPLDLTMGSASYSAASGLSSNSFDVDTNSTGSVDVEEDMANCLILLARGESNTTVNPRSTATEINPFECKTCNRGFSSFQALGGHRASHRKPKVVQVQFVDEKKPIIESSESKKMISSSASNTNLSLQLSSSVIRKPKVHECSICGAEFGSGQALGGHMRRHRVVPISTGITNNNNNNNKNNSSIETETKKQRANLLSLDLNLPAPEDDTCRESKFQFAPKEQVIVFSASPLVDCHY